MKKKKTRTLVLLCAVLLLLAGAYAALTVYNSKEEYKELEQGMTSSGQEALTIAVLDGTVTSIKIESEERTLEFALEGEKWIEVNNEGLPIVQATMNNLTAAFTELSATHTVEEKTENLSEYGLDNPRLILTGRNAEGKEAVIYVGIQNAVTSEYYIYTEAVPGVHTVAAVRMNYFARSLMDFAELPEYPYVTEGNFESLEIVNGDEHMKAETLEKSDYDMSGMMTWYVTEPFEHEYVAHTTTLDKVMAAVADLSYSKAESYNPAEAELEKMGLAQPQKELAFRYKEYSDGTTENQEVSDYHLYIGNQKEGTDYYYVREADSGLVLLMGKEALDEVFSYTAKDIVNKYFALINIETVVSVEAELDGSSYELIPPKEGDADETAKRNLYQTIIGIHAEKITDSQTDDLALLPLHITINRNTEPKAYDIRFAEYDNNYYLATVDGEGIYLVNKRDYEQYCADLKAGFEALK